MRPPHDKGAAGVPITLQPPPLTISSRLRNEKKVTFISKYCTYVCFANLKNEEKEGLKKVFLLKNLVLSAANYSHLSWNKIAVRFRKALYLKEGRKLFLFDLCKDRFAAIMILLCLHRVNPFLNLLKYAFKNFLFWDIWSVFLPFFVKKP